MAWSRAILHCMGLVAPGRRLLALGTGQGSDEYWMIMGPQPFELPYLFSTCFIFLGVLRALAVLP